MARDLEDVLSGCLLGTAIGDALGLPLEGLSPQRQRRLFPKQEGYGFIFKRGMVSDDTEHACMVAQALISAEHDPERFGQLMAWKLRFWLLGGPAGIGLATLKACLRLWLGIPPQQSGVFSAGNGPAMRAPLLGVMYGHDFALLKAFVRSSTRLTHTDPRAEYGALAVAIAAWMSSGQVRVDPEHFYLCLKEVCADHDSDFVVLMKKTVVSVQQKESTDEFVQRLGCGRGVSGYMLHTVPVVIHIWLSYQGNFRVALREALECGGDTDTLAAILGGIFGAHVGYRGLPQDLLEGLIEWPRSVSWMRRVTRRLAQTCEGSEKMPEVFLNLPGLLLRNTMFMLLVLLHGFRRLLPPY